MILFYLFLFLSSISIPNSSELGIEILNQIYILSLISYSLLLVFYSALRSNFNGETIKIDKNVTAYSFFVLVSVFFSIGYAVVIKQVEPISVITRSAHIIILPCFLFLFNRYRTENLGAFIAFLGFLEILTIGFIIAFYFDEYKFARRATDIEGVNISSILSVYTFFYFALKFKCTQKYLYLLIWSISLFLVFFTESRALIVSCALTGVMFLKRHNLQYVIGALLILISLALKFELFDRFDLNDDVNAVTVNSKIEELEILWNWFLENPLVGQGIGTYFQTSIAGTPYNYSHNIVLFYLGYVGLLAAFVFLLPIFLMIKKKEHILFLSIIIFYSSSTSFTNVKHSLFLAYIFIENFKKLRK